MMKILQVSDIDLPGRRFNGYDLQLMLNEKGYQSKQVVISKLSMDENVISLAESQGSHFIREQCRKFEERVSLHSVIYPFGEQLLKSEEFQNSDIIHYHLIFNHLLSIYSFKKLCLSKPAVWTLHDPWALTGHCVHPVNCKGWLTGCNKCPYLDRYFPLREDNSNSIWEMKKQVYDSINIDVVVSSQWMKDLVDRSPLARNFKKVHLIPFGIDIETFIRRENREIMRKNLGINPNDFVIMFRQDDQEWKGLKYIKKSLQKLRYLKNIVLLTVGKTGLLDEFKQKYKVLEYDWVNDNSEMVDLYSVADIFLMPSVAESFGMMAVEAMSCKLPVIVMEGTALPSTTYSPDCGIAIKQGDFEALSKKITELYKNNTYVKELGEKGRRLVEQKYKMEIYNQRMIELYEKIYYEKR